MKLAVRTIPNAGKSEIVGWEIDPLAGRVLKVRIAAPAVDGKANEALREFLGKSCGVSKSRVILEKGGSSRVKRFDLPDEAILPP